MAFDAALAKQSGYSDSEIADYLASQKGFDAGSARKSGYTDEEIISHLSTATEKTVNKPPAVEPQPAKADTAELIAGSLPGRIALAAASPVLGAFQIGANVGDKAAEMMGLTPTVGKATNEWLSRLRQMKEKGMAAYEGVPEGKQGWDVAGLATAALNPVGLSYTKGLPLAANLAQKVGQGAKVGGLYGLLSPVDQGDNFAASKVIQTGAGSLLGGAIPAATSTIGGLGKWGHETLRPLFPNAAPWVRDRFLKEAIGEQNIPKLIPALRNAQELVPGSKPTSAEAVAHLPEGSPVSAIQQVTASTRGGPSGEFGQRSLDQMAARESALGTIAQDSAALSSAESTRTANAASNYALAFGNKVKRDPELRALWKDPFFRDALPRAWKLAKSEGVKPTKNLAEFLHIVKKSIDDDLSKTGDSGLGPTERRAIEGVKTRLVDWLGRKNPDYEDARAQFASDSIPINQMKVGQYLNDKLISPLSSEGDQAATERAISYAAALRDAPRTLKTSTGFNRHDNLSDVLNPQQVSTAEAVAKDLARKAASVRPLQKTNLGNAESMAMSTSGQIANPLYRPIMVANAILRHMKGRSGKLEAEVDNLMKDALLNPNELANVLERIPKSARPAVIQSFMRYAPNAASAATGTAIGNSQ